MACFIFPIKTTLHITKQYYVVLLGSVSRMKRRLRD